MPRTLQSLSRKKHRELPRWQRALVKLFSRTWVEVTVGLLVIVSVVLTLVEFAFSAEVSAHRAPAWLAGVETVNETITIIFIVELSLRFLAAPSKKRYFSEYWIDIIAVLPLFRVFRAAGALRLLRLVRLLRLFGVVSRLSSHFPYVLRRGAVEYLVVCGLLVITVLFATGSMLFFEGRRPVAGQGEQGLGLEESFWFSLNSLFAGEPIGWTPATLGGKVTAVIVMFMGLTIFAMFTGTVSAFMVDRLRREDAAVDWEQLADHVVICGWSSKSEIIVREFRASSSGAAAAIAVIAQFDPEIPSISPELKSNLFFLNDDFTRVSALEQAGIHRAKTCIILSDTSGGRSEQDADARTILAALTVEKLNPEVYTCAELLNRGYGTHLEMGHVNDYVVSGEYSAYMLAQSALNRGLIGVITELLTYQRGNDFYRLCLPEGWEGRSYLDAFVELKQRHNAILIAVHPQGGEMMVNPEGHTFAAGDEIVVIAEREQGLAIPARKRST